MTALPGALGLPSVTARQCWGSRLWQRGLRPIPAGECPGTMPPPHSNHARIDSARGSTGSQHRHRAHQRLSLSQSMLRQIGSGAYQGQALGRNGWWRYIYVHRLSCLKNSNRKNPAFTVLNVFMTIVGVGNFKKREPEWVPTRCAVASLRFFSRPHAQCFQSAIPIRWTRRPRPFPRATGLGRLPFPKKFSTKNSQYVIGKSRNSLSSGSERPSGFP